MIKNFNLKTRMLISICSVAFLAFAVTIAFVAVKAGNMAKAEAVDKAEQIAYRYSGVVSGELETAMDAARTTAQLFEGIKAGENMPERNTLNGMLKQLLERNPDFIGVWTCWEPNALDGKDAIFAGTAGHDSTGRFIPYWNRGAGKTVVEPLVDYDQDGTGDYYLLSQRSGDETILPPYKYVVGGKEMLITSVVAPIEHDGRVVGVAGIDIALSAFGEMIAKIRPFETGYGFLVSNNGDFVAHPKAGLVGKNMKAFGASEAMMKAIRTGKAFSETRKSQGTGTVSIMRFVPVRIGGVKTPWAFTIVVPMDKVLKGARGIMYATILIGAVSLLALMAVVFFIARSIADPMNRVVAGLNDGAEQVASASAQVSSSSQSLAEGASEQAASIEETSSSLEEMASMTNQNAANAGQADALMKEANKVVVQANTSMSELTHSMNEISKASEETSKIIKTIDEIAFQTNLLALNAAVEAARAGEAGAGFAVVADEVRNLAMRAAEAARNTAEMIEGTVKKVGDGTGLVNTTNEAFGQVAESASKVGELVAEIAAASSEQAQGIGQVNTAVSEMDKVTQQNAASAEESASASEEMSAQAEQMKGFVGDLVVLVNGNNGRVAGGGKKSSARFRGEAKSAKGIKPARGPAVEANPKPLLALDDDLNDF